VSVNNNLVQIRQANTNPSSAQKTKEARIFTAATAHNIDISYSKNQ